MLEGNTGDAVGQQELRSSDFCPGLISDFSTSQKEKKSIPTPHTLVATTTLSASGIKRELGDLRLQMEWNWILLPKAQAQQLEYGEKLGVENLPII